LNNSQSSEFERNSWRLFQKRVLRAKFDIYVFITRHCVVSLCNYIYILTFKFNWGLSNLILVIYCELRSNSEECELFNDEIRLYFSGIISDYRWTGSSVLLNKIKTRFIFFLNAICLFWNIILGLIGIHFHYMKIHRMHITLRINKTSSILQSSSNQEIYIYRILVV
jgi:hypothetical protein